MQRYLSYIKERIYVIGGITASLAVLGIGETILFPHLLEQWSRDRNIGFLHVVIGIAAGAAGLAGLIYMIRQQYRKKSRVLKNWWWKFLLCYLIIQFVTGLLQGLIGEVLYGFQVLDYEAVMMFLYILSGLIQSLVRILFLYLAFVKLYDRGWKEKKRLLIFALIAAAVLFIVPCILQTMMSGIWLMSVRNLWEVLCWISFIVYFGENLREETKNA